MPPDAVPPLESTGRRSPAEPSDLAAALPGAAPDAPRRERLMSGPNSDSFGIAKDFRPGITHIKNNDSLPPAASDVPFTDEQNEALAANMEAALSDVDKDDPSTDPNF